MEHHMKRKYDKKRLVCISTGLDDCHYDPKVLPSKLFGPTNALLLEEVKRRWYLHYPDEPEPTGSVPASAASLNKYEFYNQWLKMHPLLDKDDRDYFAALFQQHVHVYQNKRQQLEAKQRFLEKELHETRAGYRGQPKLAYRAAQLDKQLHTVQQELRFLQQSWRR